MNKLSLNMVAAAVSTALLSAGANAYVLGSENTGNVEVYGVVAVSAYGHTGDDTNVTDYSIDNETRIGFRGSKQMTDGINVIFQVESGYTDVDDWAGGGLGFRDTFVGVEGDYGKVTVGRQLTPMYEVVDWPFTNPGLGRVFDPAATGDIAYMYDRTESIRYFAPAMGNLNINVATGRAGSGENAHWFGGAAKYKAFDTITLHATFEYGNNRQSKAAVDGVAAGHKIDENGVIVPVAAVDPIDAVVTDTFTYLVGFEVPIASTGISIAAAYKYGQAENVATKNVDSQGSYSVVAQYWNGPLGIKLGYAATEDVESDDNSNVSKGASVTSLQVMGVVNGFVPYVRLGMTDQLGWGADPLEDQEIFARVGLEYGF
ncbi:porin [Moritella sp.]|uniref:porin n=1 Tax=Moritella sp. TaxID=78556 RepID=UPI001D2F47AD|nr:porin [Moritella sp.]MCJ8349928.1 porin [Moritella sp.]NQZ39779.1 porin [Moritella sp.]